MVSTVQFLCKPSLVANRVSLYIRYKLEKITFLPLVGLYLASATFLVGVVLPESTQILHTMQSYTVDPTISYINSDINESNQQWPLQSFGISQSFSPYHPALDLTAAYAAQVYPISEGNVVLINNHTLGYGNHILIQHNNKTSSLYAHLSEINVKPGQSVDHRTTIGRVGSTGWSTGNHVHLEVYEYNKPINPLEVLPALKQNTINK